MHTSCGGERAWPICDITPLHGPLQLTEDPDITVAYPMLEELDNVDVAEEIL